jgi:hypothetical protein
MVLTMSIRTWGLDLAKRRGQLHLTDKESHSQQPGSCGEQMLASFQRTRVRYGMLGAELLTMPAYLLMWERTRSVRKWGGLCADGVRMAWLTSRYNTVPFLKHSGSLL